MISVIYCISSCGHATPKEALFVRWSVEVVEVIESKSGKMSVLDTFYVCLCMEWGFGVDGGLMPLPTRPQRYCDPASLIIVVVSLMFFCFSCLCC